MAQGHKRATVNATGCEFSRSGNEAKRGVEFYHSTRNASRIRRKVRTVLSETKRTKIFNIAGLESGKGKSNLYLDSIFRLRRQNFKFNIYSLFHYKNELK